MKTAMNTNTIPSKKTNFISVMSHFHSISAAGAVKNPEAPADAGEIPYAGSADAEPLNKEG